MSLAKVEYGRGGKGQGQLGGRLRPVGTHHWGVPHVEVGPWGGGQVGVDYRGGGRLILPDHRLT